VIRGRPRYAFGFADAGFSLAGALAPLAHWSLG
jgi:hypothetical protein